MPNPLLSRACALLTLAIASAAFAQATPPAATAPAAPTPGRGGRGGGGGAPPLGTLPPNAPKIPATSTDPYWGEFTNSDPKAIGTRLVMNYVSHAPLRNWGAGGGVMNTGWYAECCMAFGGLRFAQEIGNTALADQLVSRFDRIITPEGKALIPPADHVDRSIFGIVPMEIYRYTKNPAYLKVGQPHADAQWGEPPTPWVVAADEQATGRAAMPLGLSFQTRFWIDDMYMLTVLQVEAFRATGDKVYLDRAAKEMVAYLDKLQQPNGLFYHAESAPFFWGRGNGWVAAGMTELLSELPKNHPDYARCLDGYKKMMAGLLKFQNADGSWNQLVDKSTSWRESSCTGMFTFAFALGVRNGILDEATYKPAAKKGWTALTTFLDDNANVKEVCAGTNKFRADQGGPAEAEAYYNGRPRNIGDPHGQAAAIWAAWAMARGTPTAK